MERVLGPLAMKKGEGNESGIYRTKEQGRDIQRGEMVYSAMWYSTGTGCVVV